MLRIRVLAFAVLAATTASAQGPKVGLVEIFGLRKIKAEKIRSALAVTEGAELPPSKADTEERIESIDGVVEARLEAVCCDEGRAILYVGIEERGAPHFDQHTPPGVDLSIPEDIEATWTEFITAVSVAARAGKTEEDLTHGHSLMSDPDARQAQEKFIALADKHFALLREIIRNAADEQDRAVAAFVLGYSSKKKEIVPDLQYAIQDSDSTVRQNAMRAMHALLVYARLHPDAGMRVQPTWFVEMLHSVYFTDRTKAAMILLDLTDERDAPTVDLLLERAVDPLIEMASWRHLPHALPAFILLGRMAGLKETEIQDLWKKGEREALFDKVRDAEKDAAKKRKSLVP